MYTQIYDLDGITLKKRSDATLVEICNHNTNAKEVIYTIKTTNDGNSDFLGRTFKEFQALHKILKLMDPTVPLPQKPRKNYLPGNFSFLGMKGQQSKAFLAERSKMLEDYLKSLLVTDLNDMQQTYLTYFLFGSTKLSEMDNDSSDHEEDNCDQCFDIYEVPASSDKVVPYHGPGYRDNKEVLSPSTDNSSKLSPPVHNALKPLSPDSREVGDHYVHDRRSSYSRASNEENCESDEELSSIRIPVKPKSPFSLPKRNSMVQFHDKVKIITPLPASQLSDVIAPSADEKDIVFHRPLSEDHASDDWQRGYSRSRQDSMRTSHSIPLRRRWSRESSMWSSLNSDSPEHSVADVELECRIDPALMGGSRRIPQQTKTGTAKSTHQKRKRKSSLHLDDGELKNERLRFMAQKNKRNTFSVLSMNSLRVPKAQALVTQETIQKNCSKSRSQSPSAKDLDILETIEIELGNALDTLGKLKRHVQGATRMPHHGDEEILKDVANIIRNVNSARNQIPFIEVHDDPKNHVSRIREYILKVRDDDAVKQDEREVLRWISDDILTENSTTKKAGETGETGHIPMLNSPRSARGTKSFDKEAFETSIQITNGVKEEGSSLIASYDELSANPVVSKSMEQFGKFGFDCLQLKVSMGEMTLPFLLLRIFNELDISNKFGLSQEHFSNYATSLANLYYSPDEVLYHNSYHAADVLSTHYYFLKADRFGDFPLLDVFASLIAAAAHDVAHNGYNNRYHINSESELARLYNDQAVLENHHASVGWKLMSQRNHDFLSPLGKEKIRDFRKMFVNCILGTDMADHGKHLVTMKHISSEIRTLPLEETKRKLTTSKILPLSVHSADIANVTKEYDVCTQWVQMVMNEFFRQGNQEKKLGMEPSPLCDEQRVFIPSTQVGFIQFIVAPWFNVWQEICPDVCQEAIRNLQINKEKYMKQVEMFPEPSTDRRVSHRRSMAHYRKRASPRSRHSYNVYRGSSVPSSKAGADDSASSHEHDCHSNIVE